MICINDSKNCSSFEETKKLINDSFEQNLYEKSSFEL